MIKKIIACLTICFIITGISLPVFSDASALPQPNWSDPGISEIINISDLTGWMLNGGTYDVSTYTDAESFMNDYFSARTKTRLEGSDYQIKSSFGLEQQYYQVGDSAYAHPLDVNRVISSSFRDHSGYGRRLSSEVNDSLLNSGNLSNTKIPLLNDIEFSNFVGYNHNALQIYKNSFIIDDSDPITNVPAEYVNQVNLLNKNSGSGLDFFWSNYSVWDGSHLIAGPAYNWSWAIEANNPQNLVINDRPFDTRYMFPNTPFDVLIDGDDINGYTVKLHNYQGREQNINSLNNLVYRCYANSYQMVGASPSSLTGSQFFLDNTVLYGYYPLSNCLDYVISRFRNINLYVNGIQWAKSGNNLFDTTITPEFPDAVGGEDLTNTTWPIFRPRAPYYTSVPGVLQAIEDAIADDGELDIDDLKPYLTNENGDPVPNPVFDPEPVPIPVPDPVNPDVVPGLPILPAVPPDMPGFNGVSVLAEIINFTNQSLPTSLIVTFWGIVFGIVILGLIKILHK